MGDMLDAVKKLRETSQIAHNPADAEDAKYIPPAPEKPSESSQGNFFYKDTKPVEVPPVIEQWQKGTKVKVRGN